MEGKYSVKAFREDGTPTLNRARGFDDLEKAREEMRGIAEAMLGGYAQISTFDETKGFYTVIEHMESTRKPKRRI